MQIAKMFASLGFKVDTAGLTVFKSAITDARKELTKISVGARNSKTQLNGLRKEIDKVSAALGKIKGTAGSGKVSAAYVRMADSAHKLNNSLMAIVNNRKNITNAIGKINSSVFAGLDHWDRYRHSVVQTRRALLNLNREINTLRANSRVDVRINRRDSGGGGSGGGGGRGGAGGTGGLFGGLGLRGFLSNIVPTLALTGIGGGAGYAAKQMVEAARAQTRMENTLLLTSTSAADLADTLDFVKTEALRLGMTSVELGNSFAKMNLSAKTLTKDQKKEMFTGFSEFMVAMGTDKAGQKGILKAYNQMFDLGKVSQEEINQLTEHGIPATLVYDAAMKAQNLDSIAAVKALQQKGGLIPEKILLQLSKDMQNLANDSGALAKAKESSQFKQNVFIEDLTQTSKRIMDTGLDAQLGNVFEQLTKLTKEVEKLTVVLSETTKAIDKISEAVEKFTGMNGWLQLVLGILFFRFRKIYIAAKAAFRILNRGGTVTRALGRLFTGVLGQALKTLIKRFGGWIAVLYSAYEAYNFLYKEIEKRNAGNWSYFDELILKSDIIALKFKMLVADFLYLKAIISTGALVDAGFDSAAKLVIDKTKSALDPTPIVGKGIAHTMGTVGKTTDLWNKYVNKPDKAPESGTPLTNNKSYADSKPTVINLTTVANFNGEEFGTETRSFFVPP